MLKLFEPTKLGKVKLRNRIVFPATGTHYVNKDGTVSQRLIDWYVRRAQGGLGMIVVEYSQVDPVQRASLGELKVCDDRFIDGLSRLASSIKSLGVAAALQLHHPGRMSDTRISGVQAVAPSPVRSALLRETPHELTDEEIWVIVDEFAQAIRRAKEAGFDAVEFHGATGYLLHQFFSPFTNRRQDSWGGDTERRCRFAQEIVRQGRDKVGKDFPFILRLAVEDFVAGGLGLEESKKIVAIMEKTGIDCISVTAGTFDSPFSAVSPNKPGCYADFAAAVKELSSLPVMVAGRIHTPQLAERILQQNKADLICMCRALIVDPDLPNKAREGRDSEVRRCIACGVCGDSITRGVPGAALVCLMNPEAGREGALEMKAGQPKRVMVLGGNPAGLEAARVASLRGHTVTLLDEDSKLGGRWSWTIEPYLPDRLRTLKKLGVSMQLETPFSQSVVEQWAPDVVIATRRLKAAVPNLPGIERSKWCTADDVFSGEVMVKGKVIVIGGNNIGLEVAELLSQQGNDVTVVEKEWLGRGIARGQRNRLIDRLSKKYGVHFLPQVEVVKVTENSLVLHDQEKKEHSLGADWLVFALLAEIDNQPIEWLDGQSFEVLWVNPVQSPRDWVAAFEEGISVAHGI